MKKLIQFAKVEATGNDFIAIDKQRLNLDSVPAQQLEKMCDRQFGIGADGLIMIDENSKQDFNFSYFNADGYKSTMCGNGSRAAVLAANVLGIIKRNHPVSFLAGDGVHQARIDSKDRITVEIIPGCEPEEYTGNPFELPDNIRPVAFINTGVPHLVLEVSDNLDQVEVTDLGSRLRKDPMFPEGTNVNFVTTRDNNRLAVRTYERGVERETLSCGTGVTAAALSFWKRLASGLDRIKIETRGGEISVLKKENRFFIEGPARVVFIGQYLLN